MADDERADTGDDPGGGERSGWNLAGRLGDLAKGMGRAPGKVHDVLTGRSDHDADGLPDIVEVGRSSPADPDTDGDTISDGTEVSLGLDPRQTMTDPAMGRDIERLEWGARTYARENPEWEIDTEDPEFLEWYRTQVDLQPPPDVQDWDRDGLTKAKEDELGTSDYKRDSDGDGADDAQEYRRGTDPVDKTDTDGDGFTDGYEIREGMDPRRPDAPRGATTPTGGGQPSDAEAANAPSAAPEGDRPSHPATDASQPGGAAGEPAVADAGPSKPSTEIADPVLDGRGGFVDHPDRDAWEWGRFTYKKERAEEIGEKGIAESKFREWFEGNKHRYQWVTRDPAERDIDGDGLTAAKEKDLGTSDYDTDSDDDSVGDLDEYMRGTRGDSIDTDGDGITDAFEIRRGTDPRVPDAPPSPPADVDGSEELTDVGDAMPGAPVDADGSEAPGADEPGARDLRRTEAPAVGSLGGVPEEEEELPQMAVGSDDGFALGVEAPTGDREADGATDETWDALGTSDNMDPWPEDPAPEVPVGDGGWGSAGGSDNMDPWPEDSAPEVPVGDGGWGSAGGSDNMDPWPEDSAPEVPVGDGGWGPSGGSDNIDPWDPPSSSGGAGDTGSGGVDDGWTDDVDGGFD